MAAGKQGTQIEGPGMEPSMDDLRRGLERALNVAISVVADLEKSLREAKVQERRIRVELGRLA